MIPPYLFFQIYIFFIEQIDCIPTKCYEQSEYTTTTTTTTTTATTTATTTTTTTTITTTTTTINNNNNNNNNNNVSFTFQYIKSVSNTTGRYIHFPATSRFWPISCASLDYRRHYLFHLSGWEQNKC